MKKRTIKLKAPIQTALCAVLIIALTVCAVLFIFLRKEITELSDKLAKAQAYGVQADEKLAELQQSYDALRGEYTALEKTKAEQRNAKVVYLTFDDGPSENTVKILDILNEYNIKATFFVIGKEGGYSAEIYRRMVSDGHAVGNHTYSHEYHDIYSSPKKFWEEYQKNDDAFFEITGRHLNIMRFPGGSNNTVSNRYCKGIMKVLTKQAHERGLIYFDWNVSSLDAEKVIQDKNVIINAVLDGVRDRKSSIVLMHDNKTKKTTVEALPVIIEELKKQGYTFRALDESVESIQFLK